MEQETGQRDAWTMTASRAVWLNMLGIGLFVVSLVGYVALWLGGDGGAEFTIGLAGFAAFLGITVALLVIHEGIHGLVVRALGYRPQFGAAMAAGVLPVLYCTAPGVRFSRGQFLAVALAPAGVLAPLCAVGVVFLPHGGWLVLPAAIHLSGCVGDFVMAWVVSRLPHRTLVEDLKDGMAFHYPA